MYKKLKILKIYYFLPYYNLNYQLCWYIGRFNMRLMSIILNAVLYSTNLKHSFFHEKKKYLSL